jgi:hypothetical protein
MSYHTNVTGPVSLVLSLTRSESIDLTIIISPLTLLHLYLLLLVRLGGYIVNLWSVSSQLQSRVGNILVKTETLRITLNLDGATITSKSHKCSPITLTNFSSINLVFIFRCSSSPFNPVYV